MNTTTGRTVTTPDDKVRLLIMNANDGLPATFALLGTRAKRKVALRVVGGCKGMSPEDKSEMLQFFQAGLTGYQGVIWSGGTRQLTADGSVDPMITDVPGAIAKTNPGAIALGTVPRIDFLTLQGESSLVLDEYGTIPNPEMYAILIVQNGAEGSLGWDGDVDAYARLMENWKTYGDFSALGLIAWNGGTVTAEEIEMSIKHGWTTILIQGTGRATDEYIERLGTELPDHVRVVRKDNARDLFDVLYRAGFFPPA